MSLILILLCIIAPLSLRAGTVTLAFKTDWAEYTLTFDPQRISVEDVKKLARISPYAGTSPAAKPVGTMTA